MRCDGSSGTVLPGIVLPGIVLPGIVLPGIVLTGIVLTGTVFASPSFDGLLPALGRPAIQLWRAIRGFAAPGFNIPVKTGEMRSHCNMGLT